MVRIAIVEKEKCQPEKCGNLCLKKCPVNRMEIECIVKRDNKAFVIEPACIGCGICVKVCPFDAIHIINMPEELNQQAIHRYYENGFALYSLPTPVFGKVVGIIGKNGIGKSTAIKILAGVLKPNFGKITQKANYTRIKHDETDIVEYKKQQDSKEKQHDITKTSSSTDYYSDLIKYFKGTEAQKFFEKVKAGEIKISYKPQAVDLIAKSVHGRVGELLKKVDETGDKSKFTEICEKLDLLHVMENEVSTLSGGELQRVAIAATVLKKANLYLFDEPTSFLDIKQRIRVSKFIRELATPETAVIVIEHDLVILDYMTDFVHIMYGQEACYGVVSQIKSAREGINTYLLGYMREENIRFREKEIKFTVRAVEKFKEEFELTSWHDLTKQFNVFKLKANAGKISRNSIIGVLGENGIGKTTFVKILAGVDVPDSGEVTQKVTVSYKPQYIDITPNTNAFVQEILFEALEKYPNQIINPLNIKPLLDKKLGELSGGELQRVAIAHALSKKADLYLLDEPSAYLDVEQRLIIAKVIREVMEERNTAAIVVDHDLVFLDYLSKRLFVCEGKPAISGEIYGPYLMEEGMNKFLKMLEITLRRDQESFRPRINKSGSVLDREQKEAGKYYYG
ncbi:ribosome biogenesis/translation initiation ATPase RLI [Candidatus Woesearchaeota archaeon]|nr:ribosome biogenesis/translation initiation ATPase RLI [Candidatus Woesearchaeota archaeon]